MLRRRAIALALALASLFGASAVTPGAVFASLDISAAESQFLDLLNADRTAHGLQPLVADPGLMDVARWRSEDMVARNFLGHDLGGYTIARLLRDRQIKFQVAGENLVLNTFDDATTVNQAQAVLMHSDAHRQNILRPEYNYVGVGVATGPDRRTVYTQIFVQASLDR